MSARLQVLGERRDGRGTCAITVGLGGEGALADVDVDLELASLVAQREAEAAVPEITIWVRRARDAEWAAEALRWVARAGRHAIVRTRHVLERPLGEVIAEVGATVELEIAHHREALQRALLGAEAHSATDLLVQAQHWLALGLEVRARLSPLMPGVHDVPGGLDPLLRNLAGAEVRAVIVEVGRLHAGQLRELIRLMREGNVVRIDLGDLLKLARAYDLPAAEVLGSGPKEGVWTLASRPALALEEGFAGLARDAGLEVLDQHAPSAAARGSLELTTRSEAARAEIPKLQTELFAPSAAS